MFEVENLLVGDSLTDSELGVIKTEATSRSTNSGLYYISLACQAVLGAFDMRLGSKNGKKTMVLSISVPVVIEKPALELALPGSSELAISTPPVSAVESMPEGLKICMIDDSKVRFYSLPPFCLPWLLLLNGLVSLFCQDYLQRLPEIAAAKLES
jgi:hypothetical protein